MKDLFCRTCCSLLTREDKGSHYRLFCPGCQRVSFDYKPIPPPESCGCTDVFSCEHSERSFEREAIREAEARRRA